MMDKSILEKRIHTKAEERADESYLYRIGI